MFATASSARKSVGVSPIGHPSETVMNETNVTLIGTVASDPVERQTVNETTVCSFRVATNERRFNKERNGWVNGDPMFVTVNCWRRMGGFAASSLSKGDPVLVVGRLRLRRYEHGGERQQVIEISATAIGPDLSRCTAQVTRQSGRPQLELVENLPDGADREVDLPLAG